MELIHSPILPRVNIYPTKLGALFIFHYFAIILPFLQKSNFTNFSFFNFVSYFDFFYPLKYLHPIQTCPKWEPFNGITEL